MDTKTKKKILYVITKSVWGGAQRYVFDLATNLPKNQFDIIVSSGGNELLTQKLQKNGIRFVPIPSFRRDIKLFNDLYSFYALYRIFRNEHPDIIHLNSSKAGCLGAVAAFLYKVTNYQLPVTSYQLPVTNYRSPVTSNQLPVTNYRSPVTIFTVHGWGFLENRPRWQKTAILFFSWLAARFQHYLIHVSKSDKEATARFRIASNKKIAHIPLGIHPPAFLPRNDARAFLEQITRCHLSDDTIIIGAIAELTKNKGINHLIDAASQIKFRVPRLRQCFGGQASSKFKIIIIGGGEDQKKLQRQISALDLKDTVFLAGFIPDATQYLKALDIFVLPSLKEGLPYSLLEASHAGLPIIATSVGGIPDIIEHQKNGVLIPPADPTALSHAITALLTNEKRRGEFGAHAEKKVKLEFSFSEMLKKTAAFYND